MAACSPHKINTYKKALYKIWGDCTPATPALISTHRARRILSSRSSNIVSSRSGSGGLVLKFKMKKEENRRRREKTSLEDTISPSDVLSRVHHVPLKHRTLSPSLYRSDFTTLLLWSSLTTYSSSPRFNADLSIPTLASFPGQFFPYPGSSFLSEWKSGIL